MEFVVPIRLKIGFRRQCSIRTSTTYYSHGWIWDVIQSGMFPRHQFTQIIIYFSRGISLVTSYINAYGRMIPDTLQIITSIGIEHLRIVRIGTIHRIGKPEILPDHNSMSVTCFIELPVTNLSYPVSYHGKVHVCMISHRNIIFPFPIIEVWFSESPITSEAYKTPTVDKQA